MATHYTTKKYDICNVMDEIQYSQDHLNYVMDMRSHDHDNKPHQLKPEELIDAESQLLGLRETSRSCPYSLNRMSEQLQGHMRH